MAADSIDRKCADMGAHSSLGNSILSVLCTSERMNECYSVTSHAVHCECTANPELEVELVRVCSSDGCDCGGSECEVSRSVTLNVE